jgi:hypothetical protein
VPNPAQDRIGRGPFAALLILLSLLLGSANAAAAHGDIQAPASRLGPSRQGSAAALLPSGTRNPLDDEMTGGGGGPCLLPSAPGIVTERLPARPRSEAAPGVRTPAPRPAGACYRARAPPAS